MVQNIGLNILVPIFSFLFIIIGALICANTALTDVVERRKKKQQH